MSRGMVRSITDDAEKPGVIAGPMTFEEFLEWEGDPHVEWVNGQVMRMAPISDVHDDFQGFLMAVLRHRSEIVRDGTVRHDPFQMKLASVRSSRAPDIQYVLNEHSGMLKKTYTDGPADLVVEIISRGSRGVDRGDKYVEYEEGGVPEYWLFDPERHRYEFYQIGKDGAYRLAAIPDDGIYRSVAVPGLWLRVAWLNQRPLPTVVTVLKDWGLI